MPAGQKKASSAAHPVANRETALAALYTRSGS